MIVDLPSERALTGCLIRLPAAASRPLLDRLDSNAITDGSCLHVLTAVRALVDRNVDPDEMLVSSELGRLGLAGRFAGRDSYLVVLDLAGLPTTPSQAEHHLAAVLSTHRRRALAERATRVLQAVEGIADDDDLDQLVAQELAAVAGLQVATTHDPLSMYGLRAGGSWILDQPARTPALWGREDQILAAEGEPTFVVGPPGTGKSTLAQQVVLAGLRIRGDSVLGFPVREMRKVLYVAADRSVQASRSIRRMVTADDREALDAGLVVRPGPPLADFAKHPGYLPQMAEAVGADVIVVDSAKDVALGLSDDEVGAGLNASFQRVMAAGLDLLVLHHPRKPSAGEARKPASLADVYGSAWLMAGAGSVLLLWGDPGAALVELRHLKQPCGEVGPLSIRHDHLAGRSEVQHGVDVLAVVQAAQNGLTAREVAALFDPDTASLPPAAIEKARRRLDSLVAFGHLHRKDGAGGAGEGRQPTRYYAVDLFRERSA